MAAHAGPLTQSGTSSLDVLLQDSGLNPTWEVWLLGLQWSGYGPNHAAALAYEWLAPCLSQSLTDGGRSASSAWPHRVATILVDCPDTHCGSHSHVLSLWPVAQTPIPSGLSTR